MTPSSFSNSSASEAAFQPAASSTDSPHLGNPRGVDFEAGAGPKRPCRVTVTAPGWNGARMAAIAAGCSSVSEMLEKLGRGELSIITSDAISLDSVSDAPVQQPLHPSSALSQHVHYHAASPADAPASIPKESETVRATKPNRLAIPQLIATGLCGAVIIGSLLYIADRIIDLTASVFTAKETIEDIITPLTGEIVAGYEVTDEYGIRAFHPVTGAPNVPHNGVDLAMPIGTPIYAVGKAGETVEIKCWWDVDGGGWVVDQTADSYPGYTFQSLHMSENGCREGKAKAGEAIAYSGNSGLGTGEHYDFRVKIDGAYVPPATKYLESAVTGAPPKE
ncbi:MAG: M23 family metallopeptidase [Cyanobacteria bacterium J06623_5]